MIDPLVIGGRVFASRLMIGSGKYAQDAQIPEILRRSGAEVITVALRRVHAQSPQDNVLAHIPPNVQVLTNTSGARDADEAVRIARLARAAGGNGWIKIEVITDNKYLLPDGEETVKATRILAAEGFVVLPYFSPDLAVARKLADAGAAAVMPLGAPIGTNRGLKTRELLEIIMHEISLPVIVDAGLGKPSDACEAMEMGAAACLLNTAIATSPDPASMAEAFAEAIRAGRRAFLAGLGAQNLQAQPSSPLTGFLHNG
ncbi:MAG: thiazole synthase [Candidatus Firestonebacteria bacterium]|nr:thiazole synthase [Candidatus Firestonebacteria bacterium]